MSLLVDIAILIIVAIILAYTARHYRFYWDRVFAKQENGSESFAGAYLPSVSIVCPMKNEERVASRLLDCLVRMDYPKDNGRYEVIAIDDNSTDSTSEIVDRYAAQYPFIKAVHRSNSKILSKPAALNVGLTFANKEIVLFFDADYVPPRDCVKRLVAPFVDPMVAGVMGRVVPVNAPDTILSRLLDLERAGGYQVDQQARHRLGLIPQFGGTVGGFRRTFLAHQNGFDAYHLAEDTDMTYKAYLSGRKICYVNAAECYEEVVTQPRPRGTQVRRWGVGHNLCMFDHGFKTIRSSFLPFWMKLDGVMLLGVYFMPFIQMAGWLLGIYSYLFQPPFYRDLLIALFLTLSYNVVGNLALFTEVGASCCMDRRNRSIWLLPLMLPITLYYVLIGSRAFIDSLILHLTVRKRQRTKAEEEREKRSRSEIK